MPAILKIADLRKRYGGLVALDGVSFEVAAGEIFGLLGPNGAGKTTLLSIVSCLVAPDAGAVEIAGRPLTAGDRDLRRQIGVVPQELAIYGELSGRENLAFFGRLYGVHGPELARRVDEILTAVGLADRADDRTEGYSGGMKRRLNLAAALVHHPRLLLLDEPTAGVDPQSRHRIFEEVRRLNGEGVTIVYTSHYMEEVEALCRRVGIMDHGKLIACDSLAGLLRRTGGLIRFRVPEATPSLRERLRSLPGVCLAPPNGRALELECQDVKGTLVRLVSLLNEMQLELTALETREPSLEGVFLDLTGRQLRD